MKNVKIAILVISAILLIATGQSFGTVYPQNPVVEIKTNVGQIDIELYHDKAPVTVDNFMAYVNADFYDNLIFHRVIKNFVIQAGGYDSLLGYRPPLFPSIINESTNGLSNLRGTIAMARTNVANSATSQFYINHVDNIFLDKQNASDGVGYCVFGKVISGMDFVDYIANRPTGARGGYFYDVPLEAIVIMDVTIVPEPCTLLLLGLGGLVLRKRNVCRG